MARKILVRSNIHPYHVTCRSNNREHFWCDLPLVWKVFANKLIEITEIHSARVHAFVLMPNHFHLIVSTPEDDLGKIMQRFIGSVTKTLNYLSGRSGRVFGAKYHRSIILTENYYDYALKYVYRNPVKAGLIINAEDYRFSTLRSKLNNELIEFPLFPALDQCVLIPQKNKTEFLEWINRPFLYEQEQALYESLKKQSFG